MKVYGLFDKNDEIVTSSANYSGLYHKIGLVKARKTSLENSIRRKWIVGESPYSIKEAEINWLPLEITT